MLFNDLKNMLSESQLKVLGFLAYTGNSMGDRTMSSFCRVFGMDVLAVRAIIRELFFNKLLENNSTVVSLNVLPILMWLVENKLEWINEYKSACISGPVSINTEGLNFVSNLIDNIGDLVPLYRCFGTAHNVASSGASRPLGGAAPLGVFIELGLRP